jgi:hypothetical protein
VKDEAVHGIEIGKVEKVKEFCKEKHDIDIENFTE